MARNSRHQWLVLGASFASPWLVGMVACNDTPGGLALPDDTHGAGRAGAGANGGSGGTDAAGEAGQGNTEVAGSSNAGTGGITNATGGSGGSHSHSTGGTKSGSGGSGDTGGTTSETAGESGAGPEAGGAGDEAGAGGEAGSVDPGAAGTGSSGMAGGGGSGNVPAPLCIFSSDPFVGMDADGGAPPPGGLLVGTNAFVGPYLTDLAGLTLYIYGADFPGDCNYAPISNCYGDCAQAWMPFDAHDRSLPATLDPANFGDLDRGDGTHQTTYLGWPLYYYKSDTAPNMINGQGKGKTWFAAETVLPNLMIMRGPTAAGGIKFLGDQGGHTLYSLPGDTLGTSSASPVSNCTGDCAAAFTPFYPGDVFPVTTLEPHDVSLFQRADGKLQVAYKGAPLYSNNSDVRSGDELGVGVNGAALVLP